MKKPFVQKPTKPVHRLLCQGWLIWLGYRLFVYPLVLAWLTGAVAISGVMVQLLALLPALVATPWVLKGRTPYALLLISIVMLVYLGVAGVMALLRFYEQGDVWLWLLPLVEFVLLLLINGGLFVLLKRLPPMHQQNQSQ